MPTIAPIAEPGVTVIQEFTAASPATSSAVLPAAIVGPAFEVIRAVDSSGVLDSDAFAGNYDQFPQTILQAAFPDPRGNNAELDFQEPTIKAYYYYGNLLAELDRGDGGPNGSAFLSSENAVRKAAIGTIIDDNDAGWTTDVLVGRSFVLAFDIAAEANTTEDVTVTIAGVGMVATAVELAASINTAVGATVASVTGTAPNESVQLASTTWGASGNVNVRGANAACTALFGSAAALRVEGAGFRAQDDSDGDLVTPWIEFFAGESFVATVANGFVLAAFGLVEEDGTFTGAAVAAMSFTGGAATVPLQAASATRAGDQIFADSVQVLNGEVVEVQAARFRLGVLDSVLSTFDTEGDPTNRVYTDVEVNTLLHGTPFAPRFVWFQAQGLEFGSITPLPVAAVLVGDQAGQAAQAAELQTTFATGAKVLTGLTLIVTYIKDGVTQPQLTLTFTSDPANSAALQTEIIDRLTGAGVNADFSVVVADVASPAASFLHISTTNLGDDQTLTVLPTGTANAVLGFVGTRTHTGKDVEFTSPAVVTAAAIAQPIAGLDGNLITVTVVDSRGTHVLVFTPAALDGTATVALLAPLLEAQANQLAWDGDTQVLNFSNTGAQLVMTSVEGGAVSIDVTAAGGDGGTALGFTDGLDDTAAGSSDLAGNTLQWQLDGSTQTFETTFASDSLEDAVAAVNLVHGGNVIASINTGDQLQLTSSLLGVASRVQVANGASAAATALGFLTVTPNDDTDTGGVPTLAGSGRPNPDFFVDISGSVQLGAQILRSTLTGVPFGSTSAALYMDFDALRLDVSALSLSAEKLLTIDDQVELESLLSPLSLDNPLGLGMYFALLNSPTTPVHGIGLDEVSAALPDGTVDAYARAADQLEAKDVYGIVPLSAEELVHQLFATHVTAMSAPAQRGERIVFINPGVPTRAFPELAASGDANSTASPNELVLDQNPSAALVAAGLNPLALTADDGVYLEISIGGVFFRYSVALMNANLAQFRIVFVSPDNDDGFYSTTALTASVVDGDYVLKIRGDALLIPGSTMVDLAATADAVAQAANAYANRRVFYVFPDELTSVLDSGSVVVPGFYGGCAVAGMIGQMNPSQPFSRVPITGFSSVQGSQDTFKPSLLDQIAGGGVYILTQQGDGAPVSCRHQLSTDVSTIERRELSITKAVDFVAKYLRNILRNFIGRNNITPQFLDTLSSVVQAQLAFLGSEGLGVIAQGVLNTLVQDETQPDTILVDVQLTVLYPANYIRVTIRV